MDNDTMFDLGEFCPPGGQLKTPYNLSFRLSSIAALELTEQNRQFSLVIHFNGSSSNVEFYYDGDGDKVRALRDELKKAINEKSFYFLKKV
ncbi:MAG TPA: hypothetical protein VFM18_17615 [Methanosarcina sp.]|nr:hypothetical protein [Methanosarcina sp.]